MATGLDMDSANLGSNILSPKSTKLRLINGPSNSITIETEIFCLLLHTNYDTVLWYICLLCTYAYYVPAKAG